MGNLDGLISLLIACVELVFVLNLLVFAEKNYVNKLIIFLVILLAAYQATEFMICYFGMNDTFIVYFAFLIITLIPTFGGLIALYLFQGNRKLHQVLFIPALFFIFYYAAVIGSFDITGCTFLYAVYDYPLGNLYSLFHFAIIYLSMLVYFFVYIRTENQFVKKLNLILLTGYLITFIPANTVFLLSDFMWSIKESIQGKIAVVLALSFSYYALKNKNLPGEEKKI
ncbi:MAG: hypothetical protein JW995_08990 [Melioribacteraceae bacterium]|nr:hypothetical protein [Melioribacteraceae bacterium]